MFTSSAGVKGFPSAAPHVWRPLDLLIPKQVAQIVLVCFCSVSPYSINKNGLLWFLNSNRSCAPGNFLNSKVNPLVSCASFMWSFLGLLLVFTAKKDRTLLSSLFEARVLVIWGWYTVPGLLESVLPQTASG